jgi:hypothetical protein
MRRPDLALGNALSQIVTGPPLGSAPLMSARTLQTCREILSKPPSAA